MIHPLVVYSIYSEIHGLESLGKLIRATCSPGSTVLPPPRRCFASVACISFTGEQIPVVLP